jgi:hypothetical protein
LTKLGASVEHTEYEQLRKTEPTLDLPAPYREQAPQPPSDHEEPPAAPDEGGGWMATLKFWSVGLTVVALLFVVTMWIFDVHGSSRAAPLRVPVAAVAPALPLLSRGGEVPPLVLLPSSPVTVAAKVDKPVPVPAKAASKPPVAKAPVKPLLAKVQQLAPRKPALAKPVLVAVKKPVVLAKRAPAPKPATVKPKFVASVTPPHAQAKAAPVSPKKCLPGKLARECAANQ